MENHLKDLARKVMKKSAETLTDSEKITLNRWHKREQVSKDVHAELEAKDSFGDRLSDAMARIGVNRASLGVQDFDDAVQRATAALLEGGAVQIVGLVKHVGNVDVINHRGAEIVGHLPRRRFAHAEHVCPRIAQREDEIFMVRWKMGGDEENVH